MDFIYLFSLVLLAVLAFIFYQNNNSKLSLLMVVIGIYVVYSHVTGNTATNFKNDVVESIHESADTVGNNYGVKGYDPENVKNEIEKSN